MELKIVYVPVDDIEPYGNNPRINDKAVEYVAESIKEFGFKNPIILDKNNVIIAGHTRIKACRELGIEKVPCIYADDLSEEQVKAFRLADNKVSEMALWDFGKLNEELANLEFDMEAFGFDVSAGFDVYDGYGENNNAGALFDRYIVPPFAVLDSRKGYWQKRKKQWKNIIFDSRKGRKADLLGGGLGKLGRSMGAELTGTSEFDPVLAETMIAWFTDKGFKVFDPFAGGSVRGIVSTMLEREYLGIDLSNTQVEENRLQAQSAGVNPEYICDDSKNMDLYVQDESVDFVLTCPPYYDLEKYSEDENDLSNMSTEEFDEVYADIIGKACRKLKENRFMCVVVSNVRDKKSGAYRRLVDKTVGIMEDNGVMLYNDMILLEAVGTLAVRVEGMFGKNRKVGKCFQNVLVGYKGDPDEIKNMLHYVDIKEFENVISDEE